MVGLIQWLADRLRPGRRGSTSGPLLPYEVPAIADHWQAVHVLPLLHEIGAADPDTFFVHHLLEGASRTGSARPRFLSIGAGTCDVEMRLAASFLRAGVREFTIECLEPNPLLLARGRATALARGLDQRVVQVRGDCDNFRSRGHRDRYDGVLANGSLHNLRRLERTLDEVRSSLADGANFVASARIGRNGHQCWPEALREVQRFFGELPVGHRWNHLLRRSEQDYVDQDQSRLHGDGICAEDVLPALLERFSMPVFAGFGGAIEPFVGRAFGPNLVPHVAWDRDFIARVHDNDETLLMAGKLTPTRMFAVMTAGDAATPTYARGLAPADCVRAPAR